MPYQNWSARHAFTLLAVLVALFAITAGAPISAQQPVKDGWVTMKTHSMFVPEDALEGSNIDVDTEKGVVTLSGTVTSAAGRARALAIAKGTDGARSVVDKLRIAPAERELDDVAHDAGKATSNVAKDAAKETKAVAKTTGRKITDGWIKSRIFADYLNEDSLDDSDIDIDVANGMVTLNGTVKTAAGKARAVAIAKGTDRVHGVKDNLKVG
ncbi:MAG: BON domain-containing protein [Acidobacteria bacterium]|nr:BON domain-containing protein [Acidobacteriota bacterium]